jgi:hypothetical protein
VRDLVSVDLERDEGAALAEADQLPVGAGPGREALRADVERLEQVRLAGAVLADDEDDARPEVELEPLVRPVVAERDALDDQARANPRGGSA